MASPPWRLSESNMNYQYKNTPLAFSDIEETLEYFSGHLSNSPAANSLYEKLQMKIASICDSPFAYPDCSCYLIKDSNIRHTVNGNYVLIIEIAEREHQIKILRFLYGGRDISAVSI